MTCDDAEPGRASTKPWWRLRNGTIFFGGLFALWVGWTCVQAVRIARAVPVGNPAGPAQFVELTQSVQPAEALAPDAPDAWDAVERACLIYFEIDTRAQQTIEAHTAKHVDADGLQRMLTFTGDAIYIDQQDPASYEEFDPAAAESARLANRLNREIALEALDDADELGLGEVLDEIARTPRAVRTGYTSPLVYSMLGELGTLRSISRLEAGRFARALEERRWDDAVVCVERMLAIGRVTSLQPTMIDRLVSVAIDAFAFARVRELLADDRVPPEILGDLDDAIARQWGRPPPVQMLKGERVWAQDMLDWVHSDEGFLLPAESASVAGLGGLWAAGPGSPSWKNIPGIWLPRHDEYRREMDRVYDELEVIAQLAPDERVGLDDAIYESVPNRFVMISVLLPSISRGILMAETEVMEYAGVRAWVAVERYRSETGRLPDTLDALVPGYTDALPPDPFSPDGKLRYMVLEAPDEDGRTYWIYSVGHDATDNGGTFAGRSGAVRGGEPGTDFLLNDADME